MDTAPGQPLDSKAQSFQMKNSKVNNSKPRAARSRAPRCRAPWSRDPRSRATRLRAARWRCSENHCHPRSCRDNPSLDCCIVNWQMPRLGWCRLASSTHTLPYQHYKGSKPMQKVNDQKATQATFQHATFTQWILVKNTYLENNATRMQPFSSHASVSASTTGH